MVIQQNAGAVISAATYFPSCAKQTRRGFMSVVNGDEDAITLAIAAGDRCRQLYAADIDQLSLVLGHAPINSGPIAEVVREALYLAPTVACSTILEDELGAVGAIVAALDAVAAGRIRTALVIAAEAGDGQSVGAGAVALLVGRDTADGAIYLGQVSSEGAVVYGRWTEPDGRSGHPDRRFLDSTLAEPLRRLLAGAETKVLAVAGAAPAGVDVTVATGVYGVAGPALALIAGAAVAGDAEYRCLLVNPGRSAVLDAQAVGAPGWLPPTEPDLRAATAPEPVSSPELSLPTASPFFARSARELLRLEAARCSNCGHVAFPPSQRPICASCGGANWTAYRLPRDGTVYSYTVNRFLPTGFGDEMVLVLGELADGTRYWAPATGLAVGEVTIGAPVSLGVRRYSQHGGIPVYAMKFVPAIPVQS